MPAYRKNLERYVAADVWQVRSEYRPRLIDGGLNVKPADFQIDRSDAKAAVAARDRIRRTAKLVRYFSPVERCV